MYFFIYNDYTRWKDPIMSQHVSSWQFFYFLNILFIVIEITLEKTMGKLNIHVNTLEDTQV